MLGSFPPESIATWFKNPGSFDIDASDLACAASTGEAPEMVDVRLPDEPIGGFTAEQLQLEYTETFKDELGKGFKKYAKGLRGKGVAAKELAKDAWGEVMLTSFNLLGTATPEERL